MFSVKKKKFSNVLVLQILIYMDTHSIRPMDLGSALRFMPGYESMTLVVTCYLACCYDFRHNNTF
jgi:hypothetical protein